MAAAGCRPPTENAYVTVLREAMAVDRHDQVGIYFGTSTGQVFRVPTRPTSGD